MKKTKASILALALCLSLAACGGVQEAPAVEPAETAAAVTEKTEQTVEITMDNWQTYFELRPAADLRQQADGTVESWTLGCGLFLREEYEFLSGQVDFELTYRETLRAFTGDRTTGEYTLGEEIPMDPAPEPRAKTFALVDARDSEEFSPLSDFYGTVAGQVFCGGILEQEDGSLAALVPADMEVLHAEGTLTVLD